MYSVLLMVHFAICFCLVLLVLMQHGKGAEIGAAFGSGASQTLFGSIGAASFITKLTAILAAAFFASSLVLSYMVAASSSPKILPPQQIEEKIPVESIPSAHDSAVESAPKESSSSPTEENSAPVNSK